MNILSFSVSHGLETRMKIFFFQAARSAERFALEDLSEQQKKNIFECT